MAERGLRFAGRSKEFARASPSVLCFRCLPVDLCWPDPLSDPESLSGNISNDPLAPFACRLEWFCGLVGMFCFVVSLELKHGSLDSGLLRDVLRVRAAVSLWCVFLTSGLAVLSFAMVALF